MSTSGVAKEVAAAVAVTARESNAASSRDESGGGMFSSVDRTARECEVHRREMRKPISSTVKGVDPLHHQSSLDQKSDISF